MKKLSIVAVLVIASVTGLFAQSNKEDVDLIQSAFGKDKKILVSQYMQIAAKDSVAFWGLYDEYETKRKELGKERISLLQKYADQYATLTDAQASELAKATIANDMKYSKLYDSYTKKFAAVVGGKNSAKLFQLEMYLQTVVRLVITNNIPFIGELDKQKAASTMQHH
jgi:hypothetical protein